MHLFGRLAGQAAPVDRGTAPLSDMAAATPSLLATLVHRANPVRNLLLRSLPADDFDRVRPYIEAVRLEQSEQLFEPGTPIRHIYFPETAIISLACTLSNGAPIEVATVGREGMVGLPVFLAEDVSFVQTFTQIPGVIWRMDAEIFTRLASAPGALHGILLGYTRAFLAQIAQTAACNSKHLVEERCARWLLMTHDRVETDTFPLSYEFLAFMLGVRPAVVTLAVRDLEEGGMVEYNRGRVALINRIKLEAAACECYGFVRANFERLRPRFATFGPTSGFHASPIGHGWAEVGPDAE